MPKLNLSLVQGNNLCMVETATGTRVAQVFVSNEIAAPAEVAALFAAAPDLLAAAIEAQAVLLQHFGVAKVVKHPSVAAAQSQIAAAIAKAEGRS